jgi:T4 RnlA family RNA ligase
MKITLPIEEGYFNIIPNQFCGLDCYLITPEIDAKWNDKNLHFRSLIVDKDGEVLSSGFPKFFNYGEKTDCYPDPEKFEDWRILNKLDGSLLIADLVNGVFSMRTRGTVSYINQENYKDFELLPEKYPKIPEFLKYNQEYSLLFEILTPNNVIVVRPKDVEFYFLGAVYKETLEIVHGEDLLKIWKQIGCPPVPEQYEFGSNISIDKLSEIVKFWKGKEGIVLVYNKGQNRIKIKSDWYCFIHRIKSQLNSTKNLIEFYIDKKMPSCEEFFNYIETDFDFEIAIQLKEDIEKICDAGEKCKKFIDNILDVVHDIRKVESRKEQAEMIKRNYQQNSSYVFSILDNKEINKQQWIKLMEKFYEC